MKSANNYLLFGYTGHKNFGDELLLDYSVSQIADGSKITIVSAGKERIKLRKKHEDRLQVSIITNGTVETLRSMIKSSNIVCIGGTCFHSNKSGFFKIQLLAMLLFKKITWKNIGFESTFAPTKFKRFAFRSCFGSMFVRDSKSASIALRSMGVSTGVQADAAFDKLFLENSVIAKTKEGSEQPKIVVSIKNSLESYESKLKKIKNCIKEQGDGVVTVMPACPKDRVICEKLGKDLGLTTSNLDWESQLNELSLAQVVIAERLHHQISGFTFGCLVYCFCYMEKNLNVFEDHQNSPKLIQL